MKRSEINAAIVEARQTLAAHYWRLPAWADWTVADHAANHDVSAFLRRRQLGWDVTDFGSGRFATRGLVLFCVRNGIAGAPTERPYAEKLMFVHESQETPSHCHRHKVEDIIVRDGGNLMVEFTLAGSLCTADAPVLVDGRQFERPFSAPLRLTPGESVTIPRGLQHRFYGEPGFGPVFAGEVSQCNDDLTDNIFLDGLGRFAAIDEDEPAIAVLWNEAAAV
jgi:D-lyxose ketol-isomerase